MGQSPLNPLISSASLTWPHCLCSYRLFGFFSPHYNQYRRGLIHFQGIILDEYLPKMLDEYHPEKLTFEFQCLLSRKAEYKINYKCDYNFLRGKCINRLKARRDGEEMIATFTKLLLCARSYASHFTNIIHNSHNYPVRRIL